MHLSPGFAQDVLDELPSDARERAISAAPADVARQWQRNALYDHDAIGRLMEPVVAAFTPEQTVGDTIEALRELVKRALITYVWVVDGEGRLLGIVTMRDLLFSDRGRTLDQVMLRGAFALQRGDAAEGRDEAGARPALPGVSGGRRRAAGWSAWCAARRCSRRRRSRSPLQAGSMVGVEKEERLATPWVHSLKLRHPWLQLNLLTAFLAAAVVGMFQDTLDRLVILALFLPVLAGQSGNTGCQALAVTLRGMTLGELKPGTERRAGHEGDLARLPERHRRRHRRRRSACSSPPPGSTRRSR